MDNINKDSTPFMASDETVIMDDLLNKLKPKTCLEWGSGSSTVYFPRHHECIKKWDVMEHDNDYFILVNSLKTPNTNIYLLSGKNYVLFPFHTNQKYDFILVDGLDRVRCLKMASKCLNKGGVCVLHDSGRSEYRKGYKFFKHNEELIPGIGIGRNGGKDFRGLTKFWNE